MSEEKYPKVVVGVIIINPQGEILLVKQSKWGKKYSIPGGHVYWGEKLEDAVSREVSEETGLNISDIRQFNLSEYILGNEHSAEKHYIFIDYLCKAEKSDIVLNEESSEYIWVKPKNALDLPLVSNTKHLIEKYLSERSS